MTQEKLDLSLAYVQLSGIVTEAASCLSHGEPEKSAKLLAKAQRVVESTAYAIRRYHTDQSVMTRSGVLISDTIPPRPKPLECISAALDRQIADGVWVQ